MAAFTKKTFRKKTDVRSHKVAPKATTVRKRAFAKSSSSAPPVRTAAASVEQFVPVAAPPAAVVAPPVYAPPAYIPNPPGQQSGAFAPTQQRPAFRGSGGFGRSQGGGQQRSQGGNANFEYITTLYKSKTGSSYNSFVRPETLQILMTVREGDVVGVSETKKGGQLNLWIRRM